MPIENDVAPLPSGVSKGNINEGIPIQQGTKPAEVNQNGSSLVNGGTQDQTIPPPDIPAAKKTDGNASFLRAARAGNLEKVLDFLKNNTDINTCNSNGLNALHLASKEGHVHVVVALIERKANVDAATKKGNTALHISSLAGQEDIVRVLVEDGASVNIQSQNGFTPLYMAAQENHDTVVKFLLSNGANQSLATMDGFTPLAVALQQGHDRVVAVLLENDTRGKVRLPALHIAAKKDDTKAATLLLHTDHNPDVTSKSGFTPLHIASHYGNDNIAALLIQRRADVNFVAKHQITPLHVASKWGKENMVSLLVEKGGNIEAKTRDGLTPLHCAARSGHEKVVDMLLEKGGPITARTKNGLAPLHMASQGDHVDAARILLYHKAPVDDVTVDFLTALHVAAHCGHVRVAKLLLDRKADPNSRALNGFTPLHIACKKNRIKVVELLLKHGASIESTTESGLTPLHVASFMGCMNIVIYLIQHGASADVPTVRGETPLHLAARANQTDIIRILLRNGAQVDARAREQQTSLHIASRLGNSDIVVLLLQHGATVDAATKDSYTPLHIAAKEGQEEVASVLIEHGASLSSTTKKGFTPLHLASKYGNMKVARLLLQKDATVDPRGKNGVTPLHVAAHYDHQNVALLLLDKGASPHAAAKNGYTPLHIAARKNQMDIATTLLEYGAGSDAESKAGFTALHLSAQEGHSDMSTLLIEHGATPGIASKNGLTPLHLCSQEDRVKVAAIIVKNGADIDRKTKAGYTPLHVASHFGQMNMVKFLLQHGTNVDIPTQLGYTSLHQAAQQGHSQIVHLLLDNKAEPNMQTNDGKTALSIAEKLGYISVVETLKIVTETRVTTKTTTTTEDKYKVVVPESMHETFMSESEDEGGDDVMDAYGKGGQPHVNLPYYEGQFRYTTDDTMLGDQSYRYLTVDEMKSLGDDSLPMDVTRDEKMDVSFPGSAAHEEVITAHQKKEMLYAQHVDNIDISRRPVLAGFLVSFMVDARGGAMRGCRHSGVRVIIPPRKAGMPTRITCRYLKKDKLVHAPPLMEGEALASRILEMGPTAAKFLGPVIIEVPHFAALRSKEREIVILRSDNGETWREHTLEATEEAVQEVLNESFDGEELKQLEDLNTNRITRILTTDFPQYFAIVTRIRQEVHAIGPEGGMVSSTVVPQVQAVFPHGALTKKIKVGLQAQPISPDLVAKLLGNRVAVSPIVTVEPRRRKFHKPITLTIPVPQAASKGMINQYSGEAPTLRLLCSITGGTTRAQWEDVTGSTNLTFVNDCVSFTTTVSARFWLMDCTNIPEATKMATELYREAIHVPFMAKFVVFSKRHQLEEARVRVFCMTDDKEDKTLETQENFIEVAKSRDVEVLEGKSQYLEFAGNLVPVTKSGDQLAFNFYAFRENRLPFTVRVKDQNADPVGRVAFMRQPKVGRGDPPQTPICNLNLSLPENVQPEPAPSEPDLLALEKKYTFLSITKTDTTIHKADLRLSDISNMLANDWVALAKELEISDSDINIIKSQYPNNVSQQAIVMLRLWMQTMGNKATGNTLETGLRTIKRVDIVDECICNLEVVTDDHEKAMATKRMDSLKKLPEQTIEMDIIKEAEKAADKEREIKAEAHPEEIIESKIVAEPRISIASPVVVEDFAENSISSQQEKVVELISPLAMEETLDDSHIELESSVNLEKSHLENNVKNIDEHFDKKSSNENLAEELKVREYLIPTEVQLIQEVHNDVDDVDVVQEQHEQPEVALQTECQDKFVVKEDLIQKESDSLQIEQDPIKKESDSLQIEDLIKKESDSLQIEEDPIKEESDSLQIEEDPIKKESDSLQIEEDPIQKESDSLQIEEDLSQVELVILQNEEDLIKEELESLKVKEELTTQKNESVENEEALLHGEIYIDNFQTKADLMQEESDSFLFEEKVIPQENTGLQDGTLKQNEIENLKVEDNNKKDGESHNVHEDLIQDEYLVSKESEILQHEDLVERKSENLEIDDDIMLKDNEDSPMKKIRFEEQDDLINVEQKYEENDDYQEREESFTEITKEDLEFNAEIGKEENVTVETTIGQRDLLPEQLDKVEGSFSSSIISDECILEESKPVDLQTDHDRQHELFEEDSRTMEKQLDEEEEGGVEEVSAKELSDSDENLRIESLATKAELNLSAEEEIREESLKVSLQLDHDEAKIKEQGTARLDHDEAKIKEQGGITQTSGQQQMEQVDTISSDVEPPFTATTAQPPHLQPEKGTGEPLAQTEQQSQREDVGVVFTERKQSGDGEKLLTDTMSGLTQQHIIQKHDISQQHITHDDSRPFRHHELTFSEASNVTQETLVDDVVKPYSERKQFWESVITKAPAVKSETESDTDTGTEGTVIERILEKGSSLTDSDQDSSQKKVLTFYEKSDSSQELPSPDDISLKDVQAKKAKFEKEIKRQSFELEESKRWKRTSKDSDDLSDQSFSFKEETKDSKDISSKSEKESTESVTETNKTKTIVKMKTDHKESTETSLHEKKMHEKIKDDEKVIEKDFFIKEDSKKEKTEDEKKTKTKIVAETDAGVMKSKTKTISKASVFKSHKEQEDKSKISITEKNGSGKTVIREENRTSSTDFKESTASDLFTQKSKFEKTSLKEASKLSSSDTTESNNESFERSESAKESSDASLSQSDNAAPLTTSSSCKMHSTITSSVDEHELSDFTEDSTDIGKSANEEKTKIVTEKKVEEERRTIGDTEEVVIREITTTQEGDQEQRVVKETKTQATLMPDGSTVKTTSVTTFTTQLDRVNSEDLAEKSHSSTSDEEKVSLLTKQIKILSPEEPKLLKSPIHVPEEGIHDVVWEVSQERSEIPEAECVQFLDQFNQQDSTESKHSDIQRKIYLSEDEARVIATEIVEEVKTEALKRSPISTPGKEPKKFDDIIFLPKPSCEAVFTAETSDKIEKYIQQQLSEEEFDEQQINLIESVAAKKAELLHKRLGTCQMSVEITDEDLKSSGAELSPIEHHMERLRQMTEEDDQVKPGNEPSEADESEGSMIIHEIQENFSSGYDQANQMFNKTLDTVKAMSIKQERVIDTISEEVPEEHISTTRKKSREELEETAKQIVKEVTEKAKESESLKFKEERLPLESKKEEEKKPPDIMTEEQRKKPPKDEILKQDRSFEFQMESSMTESVEECSAAESSRAYDIRYVTEMARSSIKEEQEHDKKSPPSGDEVKLRKKSHIDEFNRQSGTDFDAYSSSGESHYFTAGEGTDSRSVSSRPCSSDIDVLLSATPGSSEYDTALTSQDGSQSSHIHSQDFSTAPSSISSRDSIKSVDSESSGHLASIELSSELSDTLVPSSMDLERDMELLDQEILEEEELLMSKISSSGVPQLIIHSSMQMSNDNPEEVVVKNIGSKMKRSMEMTFHPEPKSLTTEDEPILTGLEESIISDISNVTVIENTSLQSSKSSMSPSNISDSTEVKETDNFATQADYVLSKKLEDSSKAVTITTTSIPITDSQQTTASMCTQVTSEDKVNSKTEEISFFRIKGPTEIKIITQQNDDVDWRPNVILQKETLGGHSVGPDSSESCEPEVDQYLIRERHELEEIELEFDDKPESDMHNGKPIECHHAVERPKTPEPGSVSKLVLLEEHENMTEVDTRFSAIFSLTYDEPYSPLKKTSNSNIPDIHVTEHLAPLDDQHRYPDLESGLEFPEIGSQSSPSSVTSPKSSTTDSDHGREYCLDSQIQGPVEDVEYDSFEMMEAEDIVDIDEYQQTILRYEEKIKTVEKKGYTNEDSPVMIPSTIRAIKLDTLSPSSSDSQGDVDKSYEEIAYSSSIEEQRRWLEMQFEENASKSSYEFPQQSFVEHIYSGPLEDIEEEREDCERKDIAHLTKNSSLSSTPEFDVLAGKKFFTKSSEHDDISMSSLTEFESLEKAVDIDQAGRRSSSGSQESLNGKQSESGGKSGGDDISLSSFTSLKEFERLEHECQTAEHTELKAKVEEQILSEIEEGHESQVSESESCETISEVEQESPENYDQNIFEIDEIIRQAQTNVEKFESVSLQDIADASMSTEDRTPSAEPPDSLEEAAIATKHHSSMTASSDSIEIRFRRPDNMTVSIDSIESSRRDVMVTSIDSLGCEADISSGSEMISKNPMEWSTDSLEPTSSQATHATYQFETDSMMSGSFASGCSNTLIQSHDDVIDLMSTSMYLPEGELPEEQTTARNYEWTRNRPQGLAKEVIIESTEPEYSTTVSQTAGADDHKKLTEYVDKFNVGECINVTETIDDANNVYVQKTVQKSLVMNPQFSEEKGLISYEPEEKESLFKDEHGNITKLVRQTVISTKTTDLTTEQTTESSIPTIHSSSKTLHSCGPPSGSHSSREPLPTSLEPNTASGTGY